MSRLGIRRLFKSKRQIAAVLSAVFIISVLMFAGIFSYFHSEDVITNRLSGHNGSVMLMEPEWDSSGQTMAAKSEPGMQIPKDPFAYNNSSIDEYIRLIMTVELDAFDDHDNETYSEAFNNNKRRYEEIVKAIKFKSGEEYIPLLTLNSSGEAVKDWTVNCANNAFFTDGVNRGGNNKLEFCFYYIVSEETPTVNSALALVAPSGQTAKLFDRVDIPIYKKDYLGVFDQGYSITVSAEAIPADGDEALTVKKSIEKFEPAQH